MAEKNLDFDTIIDRRNTCSLKYDFAKERNMPEVKLVKNEGTYLLWLDFRELQLSADELEELIVKNRI